MADKNKVLFGLENVHFAFEDEKGEYEKPIAVPGGVNVALTSEGDEYKFYADNRVYYSMDANNGYTGDLELAKLPDEIVQRGLGWEEDEDTGAVIEVADGKQRSFALLFDVSGDQSGRRYVFYDCKMARPDADRSTTEETPEVQTETATLTIIPKRFDNILDGRPIVKAHIELSDKNAPVYNRFFEKVYIPGQTGSSEYVPEL